MEPQARSLRFKCLRLFLVFSFFSVGHSSFCQNNIDALNGYKYVYILPIKYQDGSYDKFSLMSIADKKFSDIGFQVVDIAKMTNGEKTNIKCQSLTCHISHTGNAYGKNSLKLLLTNCRGLSVYENDVSANAVTWAGEYTVAKDLEKCIKKAFQPLEKLNYSYDEKLTPLINDIVVEKTNESEESLRKYFSQNSLNEIEGIYKSVQNATQTYYKIGIKKYEDKYKIIIIEAEVKAWKPGEVKGYLEPTSSDGIFSAKWYLADKDSQETFLTLENGGFFLLIRNPLTGETIKDAFIKMFPINSLQPKNIQGSTKFGSGFFLSTDGIIATNAHVIEGGKKITIKVKDETGENIYNAKIILSDNKNDVAILKIDDNKFKVLSSLPYGISESSDVGEKVFTIGFPLSDVMGDNFKVTDGIISSKSGIENDVRYFQITVPLQPGNSGGPLFNSVGNVVGITSAKLNSSSVGTQVENVNYAIKISYLLTLYNMLPNVMKVGETSILNNKELKEQVKVLQNYVCLIEVGE
jgi:S1-C subfamily serine protease